MVRVTEYYATASKRVFVPRTCSSCGGSWKATFDVEESVKSVSQSPLALEVAKRSAEEKVEKSAKQTQRNVYSKVLCPVCNHFCVAAMEKFFPNGYAKGILSRYIASGWIRVVYLFLLVVVALGLVTVLLGGGPEAMDWTSDGSGETGIFILILGLAVAAGCGAVWNLWYFIRFLMGYRSIVKLAHSSTDDELLSLILKCYKANNESLIKSLHWIKIPIKQKTGAISKHKNAGEYTMPLENRIVDLRSDKEREMESRAKLSLSNEDELLAQKLCKLIHQAHTKYSTNKDAYEKTISEIKEIGKYLCENGGSDRMVQVAYRVQALGARVRDCELFWEDICGWRY